MGSFLKRWIGAPAPVLGTVNPSGCSYVHWLAANDRDYLPVKFVLGIAIVIGFVIYWRATWESLGALDLILTTIPLIAIIGSSRWRLPGSAGSGKRAP